MPDLPQLGQGTWHLGERGADRAAEADALRLGLDLGMALIDTAEMYADGGAEQVVAQAIEGRRHEITLVSKAYPHNAGRHSLPAACDRSLQRLGTDHLDLYLLHWPGSIPLTETVEAFTRLIEAGKIKAWGVSNFDLDDMQTLTAIGTKKPSAPGSGLGEGLGHKPQSTCATNQVLYNLQSRGIEFDLLPWCRAQAMPLMAYSPLFSGKGGGAGRLLRSPALQTVASRHNATPAQIALAWTLQPGITTIPKAANPHHVRENAAAARIHLTPEDHATLDAAHPPPRRKQPLDIL